MSPRETPPTMPDPLPAIVCAAPEVSCVSPSPHSADRPDYADVDPVLIYLAREFPEPPPAAPAHVVAPGFEGPESEPIGRPGDRGWAGQRVRYVGRLAPVPMAPPDDSGLASALASLADAPRWVDPLVRLEKVRELVESPAGLTRRALRDALGAA